MQTAHSNAKRCNKIDKCNTNYYTYAESRITKRTYNTWLCFGTWRRSTMHTVFAESTVHYSGYSTRAKSRFSIFHTNAISFQHLKQEVEGLFVFLGGLYDIYDILFPQISQREVSAICKNGGIVWLFQLSYGEVWNSNPFQLVGPQNSFSTALWSKIWELFKNSLDLLRKIQYRIKMFSFYNRIPHDYYIPNSGTGKVQNHIQSFPKDLDCLRNAVVAKYFLTFSAISYFAKVPVLNLFQHWDQLLFIEF